MEREKLISELIDAVPYHPDTKREVVEAILDHLSALGLVIVPREPTEAMLGASYKVKTLDGAPGGHCDKEGIYRAMLCAVDQSAVEVVPVKKMNWGERERSS